MFRIKDYHLHLPNFSFDDTQNLRALFGIRIVRDLVNKTAMFFLPLFLYLVGSQLSFEHFLPTSISLNPFQTGMLTLSLYYIFHGIIGFFVALFAGSLYQSIGYQKTFVFSFLLRCIFFAALYFSKQNPIYLIWAVIFDALNTSLFWGGYYTLLSTTAKRKNMGKDVGFLYTLIQIVAVISPAISGFIGFALGIEVLFLIGLALTLLSSIFAFKLDVPAPKDTVSYAKFRAWLHETRFMKLSFSFAGKYVYDAAIYLWPLYIFFVLGSIDRVGYLYTVSLFLAVSFTYFIGSYTDSHTSKKPFYFSGGVLFFITLLRTQVITPLAIALVDTFDKLTANVYSVYFDTMFMRRGKGHLAHSFFIYREMMLNVATVFFWSFAAVFFLFFSGWQALYVLASIGVLIGLLMKDSKNEE